MRKFALLVVALFITIFSIIQFASALAVSTVPQGGTGWGALKAGTLLIGNGTTRIGTTTAATQGYQLVYLNAAPTWVATTTYSSPLSWSNGAVSLSTAGAWSGNAGTATALAANGTNCSAGNYPLGVDAGGNAESCTTASTGTLTAVTGAWPILSSGSTAPIISWAGLATSSGLAAGRVHYSTGVNTFADIATSSETCSAPLLCAAHTVLTGGGAISWLGLATTSQPFSSNLLVSNGTSGVYGVATSSLGVSGPITFSGTIGAQVGGATGSFGCSTCNTSNATVSSVAASVPSIFSISGSPITTSGTLAMTYSGTALPIANGGTNATSFTTTNNAVYYTGSAFATAGATQAVTTPFASSTAQTVSNSAYFTNGPVCISCTNANSALLQVGAGTDANTVGAQLYLNIAGNARFAMRDSTNDIEFGGGTDSSGQAFFGTRTNQKFNIQVNGNNYAVFDTSGQFGIFTLAAATGNTLCYNTTSNTGYDTISTCSSLRALKKNIKPLALPSDLLMHLNPVSFTDRASNENRYGFIAEDVNTVDPVLSSYYHGTLNGVDYNGVTSLLVKTVQDQQHTIDDLTKRIDALEKK